MNLIEGVRMFELEWRMFLLCSLFGFVCWLFGWLGWMQIQFVSSFHYHHRTSATEGSITNRIEQTYGNHKEIRTNILFTFHQTDANTNKQTKATETFQFISKMNSHFWGCKFCIAKGAFSGELGSSERTSCFEIIENGNQKWKLLFFSFKSSILIYAQQMELLLNFK